MPQRCLNLLILGLLFAAPVSAQGLDIVATPGDTVFVTGGDLRGLAWLDPDHRVALIADGDPAGVGAGTVELVWYTGNVETRRVDQTGRLTRGLAFDGKYLWSLGQPEGSPDAVLYKLEGDTLYVDGEYATPGHSPMDLAWDGSSIWMTDRDRGRLDRFSPVTEQVTRSVTTPGFSPVGLTFDGRFLWTADKGTGRLYRLSPGGGAWNGTVVREGFDQRGREILLAWDGARIWAVPAVGGVIWELRQGGKSE
jgi:hypothetical protein